MSAKQSSLSNIYYHRLGKGCVSKYSIHTMNRYIRCPVLAKESSGLNAELLHLCNLDIYNMALFVCEFWIGSREPSRCG